MITRFYKFVPQRYDIFHYQKQEAFGFFIVTNNSHSIFYLLTSFFLIFAQKKS